MPVPTDINISVKEDDKISKYKNLKTEIEKMQHLKNITMPVREGSPVMIKQGIDKYINKIPDSPSLCEIQKKCSLRNCSCPWESRGWKYHPK